MQSLVKYSHQNCTRKLQGILPASAVGAVCPIRLGDAEHLTPAEFAQCAGAVPKVHQERGTARNLARDLLVAMGASASDILRSAQGVPIWPAGVVGSMSHDDEMAAVVIAPAIQGYTIGVDIEPAEPIPSDIVNLVASRTEIYDFGNSTIGLRLLFSIKEAVYKSVFPQDEIFLEFLDVSIDRESQTAVTKYGRSVNWRAVSTSRVIAVAWA